MRKACGLIVAGVAMSWACSSSAPDPSSTPARNAPPPQAPRVSLDIGSVTPEHLSVSRDQIGIQTLTVSYSIPDPESVTEAQLRLYVGEVGYLATQPIEPRANGTAQFSVLPRPHSLGPTVRFRAACPNGTTEWHTLGTMPLDYDERMAKVFRIASVNPQSIPWSQAMNDYQEAAGKRVFIGGPGLPADCRIEAQANGSPIELNNVLYLNRRYEGLLMYRDINFSTISPRYAELKLSINRGGRRLVAIKRLAFAM